MKSNFRLDQSAINLPLVTLMPLEKKMRRIPAGQQFCNQELKDIKGVDASVFEVYWEDGYQGRGYVNIKTGEIWSENYQWDRGNRSVVTVREFARKFTDKLLPYVADISEDIIKLRHAGNSLKGILMSEGFGTKVGELQYLYIKTDKKTSTDALLLLNRLHVCFSGDYKMTYPPSYAMHLLQAEGILEEEFRIFGFLSNIGYFIETVFPYCHLSEKEMLQQRRRH